METMEWLVDLAQQPTREIRARSLTVCAPERTMNVACLRDDDVLAFLSARDDARIVPVQVLNFEDAPAGQNVNTVLVSAFQALAEHLDDACGQRDWRLADAPGPRQRWNDIYRKAVLGTGGRGQAPAADGRECFVALHREADGALHTLADDWRDFLDAMVDASRRRGGAWGVFVLVIRNLSNARDPVGVLDAIRLFGHRRLAFLVSGHEDLARPLTRAFYRRMADGLQGAPECMRAAAAQDAETQARQTMARVLGIAG